MMLTTRQPALKRVSTQEAKRHPMSWCVCASLVGTDSIQGFGLTSERAYANPRARPG